HHHQTDRQNLQQILDLTRLGALPQGTAWIHVEGMLAVDAGASSNAIAGLFRRTSPRSIPSCSFAAPTVTPPS
ncbi:hypothetical protein, partial [Accumulibacter sp.]|uniref:hypothetical protein n=1 Tax=Accumulibacter sp. TaxID=2053492 RepID=UPI0025D3D49F